MEIGTKVKIRDIWLEDQQLEDIDERLDKPTGTIVGVPAKNIYNVKWDSGFTSMVTVPNYLEPLEPVD